MNIRQKQEEIIEEFALFDDWTDRYEHIISLGKDCPALDPAFKTDENLIKGCQSRVWLHADMGADGAVHFSADSDAIITKGLVALVIRVLDNETPEDIIGAELFFIDRIGLREHLSPTRSNGLLSMVKKMKMYGLALAGRSGIGHSD